MPYTQIAIFLGRNWKSIVYIAVALFMTIFFMFGGGAIQQDNSLSEGDGAVLCRPSDTPVTAEELDQKLKGEGVFEGHGKTFYDTGKKYGVDPVLVIAIAMHETGHGKSKAVKQRHNPGGLMGKDGLMTFASLDEGIDKMTRNLKKNYISQGLTTPAEIGPKYAPVGAANDPTGSNSYWISGVTKNVKKLGGLTYKCESANAVAGDLKNVQDATQYPYKNAHPSGVDKWGFYVRQCTSFVAWRLNDMGVKFQNRMKGGHFSNAENWDDNARKLGYRVDKTAEAGAVAQWDAGAYGHSRFGHVAIVKSVKGDQITIEEYNMKPYRYSTRTISASKVSHYIHFK
jgi:surface antigen